ncbi:hypothetical protein EJB05_10545, partial [Eragrostis curvula]
MGRRRFRHRGRRARRGSRPDPASRVRSPPPASGSPFLQETPLISDLFFSPVSGGDGGGHDERLVSVTGSPFVSESRFPAALPPSSFVAGLDMESQVMVAVLDRRQQPPSGIAGMRFSVFSTSSRDNV